MTINYQCCLNPSLARPGEVSYTLAHIAGRTMWHRLFDNLPTVERLLGDESSNVLLAFLADCEERQKSLDWRMALMFFDWLQFKPYIPKLDDNALLLEFLGAAGARWAGEVTHVGTYRMVLGCQQTNVVVGVARSASIDAPAKIYQLAIDTAIPPGARFQFSRSEHHESWCVDRWEAVF